MESKNKYKKKKKGRSDLWLPETAVEEGELDEGGWKLQMSSTMINRYKGHRVGQDDSSQHSCVEYMKVKKAHPNSYHIAKYFFFFFVSIWDGGC